IKGHALSLKIAAGNVPSFVDLPTGRWGTAIQDPLNSGQTPTMTNFATLADVLAGCATRVIPDACSKLYAAAAPPTQSLARPGRAAAEGCGAGGGVPNRRSDRHADRGPVDREISVVPARPRFRAARSFLPHPAGQDDATGAILALSKCLAERVGAASEV